METILISSFLDNSIKVMTKQQRLVAVIYLFIYFFLRF